MKDYYQYKKTGYKLPKTIYAKTVKTIQSYTYYQGIVNMISNKSVTQITQKDVDNKALAEKYIEIIDSSLLRYVHEDYQEAVFRHLSEEIEYEELEIKYHLGVSSMKRWTQRFVYGVAKELGEVFYD